MIDYLPHFHALLNAMVFGLVSTAWFAVRSGNQDLHKRCLWLAVTMMVLFLISYLTYHIQVGIHPFTGKGWIRTVYYTFLVTHILMALTALVLVPFTFVFGLRGRFSAHRKVGRWTMPIWLYASGTGLVIYGIVYH